MSFKRRDFLTRKREKGKIRLIISTIAYIAMMQHEVVDKRKWLDSQRFLDMVGTVNLIPDPNSTELAIHIGYERAGWRGSLRSQPVRAEGSSQRIFLSLRD